MKNNILWFEKPAKDGVVAVHFNSEGLISFNTAAKQILPEYIKFGFSPEERKLYITESIDKSGVHVSSTPKSFKKLTSKMYESKISFPCHFVFEAMNDKADLWEGILVDDTEQNLIKEVTNTAKKSTVMARNSNAMQKLLEMYKQKIKYQCNLYAKTIPREDRLSTAQEGFMQAVLLYKPNLQNFSDFAMDFVKDYLKSNISQYSAAYTEYHSLYQTSADGSEYEVFGDKTFADDIENMLFKTDIKENVSPMAYEMARKLSDGRTKEDILDEMHISEKKYDMLYRELYEILKDIYPDRE